jgi:hypothetical protein
MPLKPAVFLGAPWRLGGLGAYLFMTSRSWVLGEEPALRPFGPFDKLRSGKLRAGMLRPGRTDWSLFGRGEYASALTDSMADKNACPTKPPASPQPSATPAHARNRLDVLIADAGGDIVRKSRPSTQVGYTEPSKTPGKTHDFSGADHREDQSLREVATAWKTLPDGIRAQIVALVRSVKVEG